jgi:large conductance mechanosensitive channel
MKLLHEFKAFAMRGNVIDLAVGVIIGAAFTSIVDSIVKDLLNPVIGLLIGGIDFSNLFLTIKAPVEGATYPTLKAAQEAGAVTINYGLFVNAIIKFSIVAFVVFSLVRSINKLMMPQPKEPGSPPPPRQEVLLEEIRDLLKKQ